MRSIYRQSLNNMLNNNLADFNASLWGRMVFG